MHNGLNTRQNGNTCHIGCHCIAWVQVAVSASWETGISRDHVLVFFAVPCMFQRPHGFVGGIYQSLCSEVCPPTYLQVPTSWPTSFCWGVGPYFWEQCCIHGCCWCRQSACGTRGCRKDSRHSPGWDSLGPTHMVVSSLIGFLELGGASRGFSDALPSVLTDSPRLLSAVQMEG